MTQRNIIASNFNRHLQPSLSPINACQFNHTISFNFNKQNSHYQTIMHERRLDTEISDVFKSIQQFRKSIKTRKPAQNKTQVSIRASKEQESDKAIRNEGYRAYNALVDNKSKSNSKRSLFQISGRRSNRLEKTCNITLHPIGLVDRSLVGKSNEESFDIEREIQQMVIRKTKKIKETLTNKEREFSNQGIIKKEWHDTIMGTRKMYLLHTFKKYEFPRIIEKIRKSYKNENNKQSMHLSNTDIKKYKIVQKLEGIFNWNSIQLKNLTCQYISNKQSNREMPQAIKEQYLLEKRLTKDMATLGILNKQLAL